MRLLIVESPSKTEKIAGYLGEGWQVAASFGHVRDLPVKAIGVESPEYWPDYEIGERSGKTVAKLRKLAQSADEIWLATDPDREGEAIAWHLEQLLGKGKTVRRVTFNEITRTAVQQAVKTPRSIDRNLFLAQQGRRVLDRLFGYKVSPVLGNKLGQRGISAGRVQSVALRLVAEREEAIRGFVKTDHFGVRLDFLLTDTDGAVWSAKWDSSPIISEDAPYITDRTVAQAVLDTAMHGVSVKSFTEKEQQRRPPAPFTTSTLQQAAANLLKISVDATMQAAQALFEAGLITYHRTDNPNLSQDGIDMIRELLHERGQDNCIPEKAHTWKAKKGAQEAHEAIRPTDFHVYKAGTGNQDYDRLYQMIWRRAVASQMKAAVFKVRSVLLESVGEVSAVRQKALFKASGQELIFDGWMKLSRNDYTEEKNTDGDDESAMPVPALTEGTVHTPDSAKILELETKPPRRFSETSLVKALEREGIGRPSTYASIISTIVRREYVELKQRLFEPTPLGEAVVKALRNTFSFMEIEYTKEMEEQLDRIAQGQADYADVVGYYDQTLDDQLRTFTATADTSVAPVAGNKPVYSCPECKSGYLRRIKGRNGFFWGCSAYQSGCKCSRPDKRGKPGEKVISEQSKDYPCPACGNGFMQRRPGKKKGTFWWGCNCYPECKHTMWDKNGQPTEKSDS